MDHKYLLKDFKGIISLLEFYSKRGEYGIIDKIGLALSPQQVVDALYEALRIINVLESKRIIVRLRYKEGDLEREALVTCCDYGSEEDYPAGVKGVVVEVVHGDIEVGRRISCLECPERPSKEEIDLLYKYLSEDQEEGMRIVKSIATLALAG